jgi:predicted neuraminidase
LQNKHVHGSSIVEAPNGDFLACWFYGSGERKADDVLIQGARLKKGESAWSDVYLMADTPNLPDCNPVLFIDQNERLWLFWIAVQASRWERSILRYRLSTNYQSPGVPHWDWQDIILFQPGEVFAQAIKDALPQFKSEEPMWSEYAPSYSKMTIEAAQDPVKRQAGWMTRIHPLVLPSGRILLPLYSDGYNVSAVAISDDIGSHWRLSLPMVGLGPIQPTIVRKKDGTLVSYMRDSGIMPPRVLRSVSKDDGESWSLALDTDIPNPGSSLEVITLKDGRWFVVYNDTEEGRHRLAVSLSDDEGESWPWKRYIEKIEKGGGSFAYPSMIQSKDGMIHLTYSYAEKGKKSIKHVVFNTDWIISTH